MTVNLSSVSAEELRDYVGASSTSDVERSLDAATELLYTFLGSAAVSIPTSVLDSALLEVASELYNRKNTPSGVMQVAVMDGSAPVRTYRDPMTRAYPLLRPYVGGGFA